MSVNATSDTVLTIIWIAGHICIYLKLKPSLLSNNILFSFVK